MSCIVIADFFYDCWRDRVIVGVQTDGVSMDDIVGELGHVLSGLYAEIVV